MRALHGDKLVRPGDDDFAVNVVAGAAAAWLTDAVQHAWERIGAYPDETEARAAIAAPPRRRPRAGARAQRRRRGLLAARRGHADDARAIAIQMPAFGEPAAALRAHGHEPQLRPPRPAPLRPQARADADLVFVTNPCNPTGVLHRDIERSPAPAARSSSTSRSWTSSSRPHPSVAGTPDTVVLRSLTKAYSIPGLRAGYLIGRARARRSASTRLPPGLAGQRARARRDDRVGEPPAGRRPPRPHRPRSASSSPPSSNAQGLHVYPGARELPPGQGARPAPSSGCAPRTSRSARPGPRPRRRTTSASPSATDADRLLAALPVRTALAFLTRLPVRAAGRPEPQPRRALLPARRPARRRASPPATRAGADQILPPLPATLLALAAAMIITGALHEDGLADVADAVGAHTTSERRLEILKDPRVGTFGALALILVTALIATRVAALDTDRSRQDPDRRPRPRPRRDPPGLAHPPARQARRRRRAPARRAHPPRSIAVAIAAPPRSPSRSPPIALAAARSAATAITALTLKHGLGGITGDGYGATAKLTELAVCLTLCAWWT